MNLNATPPPADFHCYQLNGLIVVPRVNQAAMDRLINRNPRHARRCYCFAEQRQPSAANFRQTRLLGFTVWIPRP